MICKKCGQFVPDGVYYCKNCGEPVSRTYTQQPFEPGCQNTQSSTQQGYRQYNTYTQPYTPQAYEYMVNSKIEEARTLGILSIILGIFVPILGIVLGCIGISKINEIPFSNQYRYETELNKKRAKSLCITGIVLPIVLWILAIIFAVFFWGMMFSAMY